MSDTPSGSDPEPSRAGPPLSDPRLAAIEQNLLWHHEVIASSPVVTRVPADDVLAFHSEFPLVSLNMVAGARFGGDEEHVRSRTEDLLGEYFARGHPFAWWPTPSTTSPALEETLLARGMESDDCAGVYADLPADPVDPDLPEGLHVELGADPDAFGLALAVGNDLPADYAESVGSIYRLFRPDQMLRLVVRDEDEPVASGALLVSSATAGIYCVAVNPSHRRRGLGSAIVGVLGNLGAYQGCTHAVAHVQEEALPLFDHLGFARVCDMPEYGWIPVLS